MIIQKIIMTVVFILIVIYMVNSITNINILLLVGVIWLLSMIFLNEVNSRMETLKNDYHELTKKLNAKTCPICKKEYQDFFEKDFIENCGSCSHCEKSKLGNN